MALLKILTVPHPFLKRRAEPVASFGPDIRRIAGDLIETMRAARGYGLAAPQVHIGLRMFALEAAIMAQDEQVPAHVEAWVEQFGSAVVLVNPEIIEVRGEPQVYEEGCLSVPGVQEAVRRPQWVRIRFQDPAGAVHQMEADGVLAVAVQHETDHLDGKLFIDRLSSLKRNLALRKARKHRDAPQPASTAGL